MNKLLLAASVFALCAGPVLAQDISNSPNSAASGSNSNAVSGSVSGANNGGVNIGPIDASSRTTSTSDSAALSGSSSLSQSQGGAGGSASSNASATGGTSSAVTGPSSATANPTATNAGNAQNITFNSTSPKKLETVPQVYAPALSTTLTETCMGSTSGGVSVMGFGGTLGSTWNDTQCVRRLNAREMAQTFGDRDAARALLCQDKDVAEAYAAVGQSCFTAPQPKLAIADPAPQVVIPPPPVEPTPAVTMKPIPNPAKSSEADGEKGR